MDRRSFLRGASACAIAAVCPPVGLQESYRSIYMPELVSVAKELAATCHPRIFEGSIGTWSGIIFREVDEIDSSRFGITSHIVDGGTWE